MGESTEMEKFFSPRTIAVAGASNKPGKMGNLVLQRLVADFSGQILPIHPTETEIAGLRVYASATAMPEPVDLLIALVPANQLLPLVESCQKGQVKFLLAIPSGFGEVSPDGKVLERQLLKTAAQRGMRIVGPNTAGMMNSACQLNASLVPELPPTGAGLSIVTQSGGFAMAVSMYALDHQMPIAKLCDLGNTADVQIPEILRYLRDDSETLVAGLFLEAIQHRDTFWAETCKLAAKKPVILTALGRTTAGGRASLAHLGIPPDAAQDAQNYGKNAVISAQSGLELLQIAKGLCWQPRPNGRKVGILTGTGGLGAEIADFCVEYGLKVCEFSSGLQEALAPHLPSYASLRNPVDLTPIWWDYPEVYPPLIRTLLASDEVDLLMVNVTDVATGLESLMYALTEAIRKPRLGVASMKPVYLYWGSRHDELKNMRILEAARIPCYQSTLEMVRVASAIAFSVGPPSHDLAK
jgi:acetyltransferase